MEDTMDTLMLTGVDRKSANLTTKYCRKPRININISKSSKYCLEYSSYFKTNDDLCNLNGHVFALLLA